MVLGGFQAFSTFKVGFLSDSLNFIGKNPIFHHFSLFSDFSIFPTNFFFNTFFPHFFQFSETFSNSFPRLGFFNFFLWICSLVSCNYHVFNEFLMEF